MREIWLWPLLIYFTNISIITSQFVNPFATNNREQTSPNRNIFSALPTNEINTAGSSFQSPAINLVDPNDVDWSKIDRRQEEGRNQWPDHWLID